MGVPEPLAFCRAVGCGQVVSRSQPCPAHGAIGKRSGWTDERRGSAASRGYDATWTKFRNSQMAKEPLCRACDSKGLTVLAKELDHIRPLNEGGERLDPGNVQPLCKDCHTLKTAKVRIGSPTYKGNWPA